MLKPDEALCKKCNRKFASGEAFLQHEGAYAKCQQPLSVGLVLKGSTWGFPGKDSTHKPRRSQAQAAMDRIFADLSVTKQRARAKDLEKVQRVLAREKDR